MNHKNLKLIIFIVFTVCLTIVFTSCGNGSNDDYITAPDSSSITRIDLQNGKNGEILQLIKNDGGEEWKYKYRKENPVSGIADKNVTRSVIDEVAKIKIDPKDIATRKPEKYLRYSVDDNSGIILNVYIDGNEEPHQTFIIGKSDIGGNFTFVRVPDKEPVFRTYGGFRRQLNKDVEDFRDKAVFDYDTEKIVKIEYTEEDGNTVILNKSVEESKTDGEEPAKPSESISTWTRKSDGKQYVTEKVESAIRQISQLRAVSFVDYPADELLKEDPTIEVMYQEDGSESKTYKLSVFKPYSKEGGLTTVSQETFLVKKGDQVNPLYLINRATVEGLLDIRNSDEEDEEN